MTPEILLEYGAAVALSVLLIGIACALVYKSFGGDE